MASAESADGRPSLAYEAIAEDLRRKIDAGEIAVGDRLAPETRLAEEFGVSRPTIREALRSLQESGFIERISPRILAVRRNDDEPAQRQIVQALRRDNVTFADLHEALLLLEPALSRLAAEKAKPADVQRLEQNLAAQERSLGDFGVWNQLDQEFHLSIAEIADNPALRIARTPVTRLLMPALERLMSSQELTAAALGRHRRILTEISLGEAEAAELMTRRHVDDFEAAWGAAGLELDAPVD